MDKVKAIEILKFYKKIDGEIEICRRILHDYESRHYSTICGMASDGQPKGKNHISHPVEAAALAIPEYVSGDMKRYEAKAEALQRLKAEVLREISRLELKEKAIVFDYYIHGMKWEDVAERNHYSSRQCKNIRDAAAASLAGRFGGNVFIRSFCGRGLE